MPHMIKPRTAYATMAVSAIVWSAAYLLLSGCAGNLNYAKQGLTAAEKVYVSAAKTLATYDREQKMSIAKEYAASGKINDGRAALEVHNQKMDRFYLAVGVLHGALLAAETALPFVEGKLEQKTDLDSLLTNVARAVRDLYAAFQEAGIVITGGRE